MFILLMHHQIAIGGCHIITEITMKPYHTLGILDPSDWNHTIITVNPLFVQFKTCRSDTSHLTLVTGMCSKLLVLVLRLCVHCQLALKTSHVSAEVAIVPDPFMLEPLVLLKTRLRLGSVLTEITGKDRANWNVDLQLLNVAELHLAPGARNYVWGVNHL